MSECREECNPDDITVTQVLKADHNVNTDWISAITCNVNVLSQLTVTCTTPSIHRLYRLPF